MHARRVEEEEEEEEAKEKEERRRRRSRKIYSKLTQWRSEVTLFFSSIRAIYIAHLGTHNLG